MGRGPHQALDLFAIEDIEEAPVEPGTLDAETVGQLALLLGPGNEVAYYPEVSVDRRPRTRPLPAVVAGRLLLEELREAIERSLVQLMRLPDVLPVALRQHHLDQRQAVKLPGLDRGPLRLKVSEVFLHKSRERRAVASRFHDSEIRLGHVGHLRSRSDCTLGYSAEDALLLAGPHEGRVPAASVPLLYRQRD